MFVYYYLFRVEGLFLDFEGEFFQKTEAEIFTQKGDFLKSFDVDLFLNFVPKVFAQLVQNQVALRLLVLGFLLVDVLEIAADFVLKIFADVAVSHVTVQLLNFCSVLFDFLVFFLNDAPDLVQSVAKVCAGYKSSYTKENHLIVRNSMNVTVADRGYSYDSKVNTIQIHCKKVLKRRIL